MAKIKLRFGENEIEIESRDFYVDNETLGEVIGKVTTHMQENKARIVYYEQPTESVGTNISDATKDTLDILDDAEIHEPEFNEPVIIPSREIRNKIKILEKNSFFSTPRTVSETVEQLREHGWSASPLEVSKTLAKMAFNSEILKNKEQKTYYTKHTIIAS